MAPLTQKQIRALLKEKVSKQMRKRLRILIESKTFRRKDGSYISLHLPAFVSLDVDDKFEITENDITYSFKNRKAVVTVWKDEGVSAHITIY